MWNPLFLASVSSFSIIVKMENKISFLFFFLTHEIWFASLWTGSFLTALHNPAMGVQLLCKGPITLRSSEKLVHLWRQRCHQPRRFLFL